MVVKCHFPILSKLKKIFESSKLSGLLGKQRNWDYFWSRLSMYSPTTTRRVLCAHNTRLFFFLPRQCCKGYRSAFPAIKTGYKQLELSFERYNTSCLVSDPHLANFISELAISLQNILSSHILNGIDIFLKEPAYVHPFIRVSAWSIQQLFCHF